ncbi:MAG: 3-hydroxybutyryl-CoA dehydrogenase [Myxococcaceae bacterium]
MNVKQIAVVGAGQMGAGIAQTALAAGLDVVLVDAAQAALDAGRERIDAGIRKLVEKGKLSAEVGASARSRLTTVAALDRIPQVDFAVEAVTENLSLKLEIFRALDKVVRPGGVLASNTSSLPITKLAQATKRPEAVIGMHFMNPVPLMALVELIRGVRTSEGTFTQTRALAEHMGKQVVVSRDRPGFIVNRVLIPMINEAIFALMEGLGSAEDIDTAMRLGTNQPMGPLRLADFIGLDTVLFIAEVLHEGLGEDKYRPCPLLREYVDGGWLGKKSGRGFYVHG